MRAHLASAVSSRCSAGVCGRSEAGVRTRGGAGVSRRRRLDRVPLPVERASAARLPGSVAAVGTDGTWTVRAVIVQRAGERQHDPDHDDDQRRRGGQAASQAVSSSSTVCGPTIATESRSSTPAAISRTSS